MNIAYKLPKVTNNDLFITLIVANIVSKNLNVYRTYQKLS